MTINDGGPAFPSVIERTENGAAWTEINEGLSARDEFAKAAMNAAMTGATGLGTATKSERTVWLDCMAQICYEVADAMLRERERKPDA
jgi:hypothetical protein